MLVHIDSLAINEHFEGYIWRSGSHTPEVFNHNQHGNLEFADDANPFIIEGQLYDAKSDTSYSIRFVDGKYLVSRYSCVHEAEDGAGIAFEEYLANNRLHQADPSIEKLHFIRKWRKSPDPLCEGMQVFTPAEMIFVGFQRR